MSEKTNLRRVNTENLESEVDNELVDDSKLPLLVLSDVLKAPLRFNIMFLLYNYDSLGFTRLQKLLHSTSGNLDHHLKKLIDTKWIKDTIFFSPRPLKVFKITELGKERFGEHVKNMQKIVEILKGKKN